MNDLRGKWKVSIYYLLLIFAVVFSWQSIAAQDPALSWAYGIGGNSNDNASSNAVDDSGNVYTIGIYADTMDADPGPDTLMFNQTWFKCFVTKYDVSGNFLWAKTLTGAGSWAGGLVLDDSANIYITGHHQGAIDVDPGPSTYTLNSAGSYDMYVLKWDKDGNFIWARNLGGWGTDRSSAIDLDTSGAIYISGSFEGTADFDPGVGVYNLTSVGNGDIFVCKLDRNGNFVWAVALGSTAEDRGRNCKVSPSGNVYSSGYFEYTIDFDPGPGIFNLTSNGNRDAYIVKFNSNGNFMWALSFGGNSSDYVYDMDIDDSGFVYTTGKFEDTVDFNSGPDTFNLIASNNSGYINKVDSLGSFQWAVKFEATTYAITHDNKNNVYSSGVFGYSPDFDPGPDVFNLSSQNSSKGYVCKLDEMGNFQWAVAFGGSWYTISIDNWHNVLVGGTYGAGRDFDPGPGSLILPGGIGGDIAMAKLRQRGVVGSVYNDYSNDCIRDRYELGLSGRRLTINPGNYIVQTGIAGIWHIDSLPTDTYTVTVDTSGLWEPSCPPTQSFVISNTNTLTYAPDFGHISISPCPSPNISIGTSLLRPCQMGSVFISAGNNDLGAGVIDSAYVVVELDPVLAIQSASLPYSIIDTGIYRFEIGDLTPSASVNFTISCSVSCSALMGQTICIQANLFPVESCTLDSIPDTSYTGIGPCMTSPWDSSEIRLEALCLGDTVRFVIRNESGNGIGDMNCFGAVRLYIDGLFVYLDSVQLPGGDSIIYDFTADGRTFRIEVDQHPLHPGVSKPSATIELCGNINNWTPGRVDILPMNDVDPGVAIFCHQIRASYDPNIKIGSPLGIPDSNYLSWNQNLEYTVQFQNTGNDTAIHVIVRDTLDIDFQIYSVIAGAASHSYKFTMYGPRVLQWTFDSIMLPDSTTNEPASHGFLSFSVMQEPNLPIGTILNNEADIYFDINAPVTTNQAFHILDSNLSFASVSLDSVIDTNLCGSWVLNGVEYIESGTYYQNLEGESGFDSIVTINLTLHNSGSITNIAVCESYTVPSGDETYNLAGSYSDTISNVYGCDSILTINLTISSTLSSINVSVCDSFTVPSGEEVYYGSGMYLDTVPNSLGCDSVITINLTVNNTSSSSDSPTVCFSYSSPGGNTYTTSGTYLDTLTNSLGCDSVIIINLTVNDSSSSTLFTTACNSYTSPGGSSYTASGTYLDTITNVSGCDSIITINLSIDNSASSFVANACESYTVPSGDETHTAPGIYMDTIPNMAGCDSILTINLSIDNSASSFTASACESYTVPSGDETHTTSGTYVDTIPNIAGCDSILTINLSIKNSTSSFVASACESYTVPSGDETYIASGTYMDTIPNMAGCDSILTINLSIENSASSFVASACESYTVPSGDETHTLSGTYMDTIPNMAGCDSILTINLSIDNSASSFTASACENYTVPSGDETHIASGTYMDTIPNIAGCDSLLTINLSIEHSSSMFNVNACSSYTVPSGDETHFSSGTYLDTITNIAGCDSLMTINLSINNSTSAIMANACSSYTVPSGDETHLTSGTFMDTIPNMAGCDSILTINLTINNTSSSINVSACNDYTVPSGDETYSVSGSYMDTIPNMVGCDSILTINLSIDNSASSIIASACESYIVPSGDETHLTSGTYMDTIPNLAGCDSIMTINLSIDNSTSSFTASACESYTVPSGDETHTVSGIYMDTILNLAGCDSILTINLSIDNSASSFTANACESYTVPSGDETHTASGIYMDTIPNMVGCDSIITINLTIPVVDTSITQVGSITLTSNATNSSYQWLDCNWSTIPLVAVPGEMGQSITPTIMGMYAVAVTTDGCMDTSLCYVAMWEGILENSFGSSIMLYPNPTEGKVRIEFGAIYDAVTVKVYDFVGQLLSKFEATHSDHVETTIEGAAGKYMITLETQSKTARILVIKE